MTFQTKLSNYSKRDLKAIADFFDQHDFAKANFKNGKNLYISDYYGGETTSVKLKPRENYTTFYKSSTHGGVLVFEYTIENDTLKYECYSPIWLFGIWIWKLDFKENPSRIFKYLKEGHSLQQSFFKFLDGLNN